MSHTKGKWTVTYPDDCSDTYNLEPVPTFGEKEANKKLMEAAPEMLEALKELTDIMDGIIQGEEEGKDYDSFTLSHARAAIKKATT